MNLELFFQIFGKLDDERQASKVTYSLFDILFTSICAVLKAGLTEVNKT
ncbi:transposase family protein [Shewanella sp. 202IG2-18]|nr:transposase family protein [Parashewanella hymeniacidonis]MBM7074535.1 transposase family protein [Parashewanella hymeniacidonis]